MPTALSCIGGSWPVGCFDELGVSVSGCPCNESPTACDLYEAPLIFLEQAFTNLRTTISIPELHMGLEVQS